MECQFRACKSNKNDVCQKYKAPEEMLEDFKKGGGCAFTWFFSGKVPQKKLGDEKLCGKVSQA